MAKAETGSFDNVPDLRHKVRRLNWFRQSLAETAQRIGQRYGIKYSIDDRALLFAFFAWADRFEAHREESGRNRRDFTIYAGGLMLFELLKANPVRCTPPPDKETSLDQDPMLPIVRFWPDGFVYANYCLAIVKMILEQDFGSHAEAPRELADLRLWQSFRENLREDPGLAVAFFDVFMGVEPNWRFPESFLMRPAVAKEPALLSAD
jgi:hypothetical protein